MAYGRRSRRRGYSRSRRRSRYRRAPRRLYRRSFRRSTFYHPTTDNQLKAIDYAWNRDSDFNANPFYHISSNPQGTFNMLVLNRIQQGTSFFNRIGRKITVRSVNISGNLELYHEGDEEKATEPYPDAITVRMVLVYDRQPNGSLPAFNDIFASFGNTGAKATTSYTSPLDPTKSGRFRILRDKYFNLKPSFYKPEYVAGKSAVYASRQLKEYIKLPNLETVYQSTSDPPTIGDIASGALYLIFRASLHGDPPPLPEGFYTSMSNANIRVRYDDI